MNSAAEKKLYNKLKRQRLGRLLSELAGVPSGQVAVEWRNGGVLNSNLDRDCTDILNSELDNSGYTGKVKYRFHDQIFIELTYL